MAASLQITWSFGAGSSLISGLSISDDLGATYTTIMTGLPNSGSITLPTGALPGITIKYNKVYFINLANKCADTTEERDINDLIDWQCPIITHTTTETLLTRTLNITASAVSLNNLKRIDFWLTDLSNVPVGATVSQNAPITGGVVTKSITGISPGTYKLKVLLVADNDDTHDCPQSNITIS